MAEVLNASLPAGWAVILAFGCWYWADLGYRKLRDWRRAGHG